MATNWWDGLALTTDPEGQRIGGARVLDSGGIGTTDWNESQLAAFAEAVGLGDLWKSGYTASSGDPTNTLFDSDYRAAQYSPALMEALNKYQFTRLGAMDGQTDRGRQLAAVDSTGKVVWGSDPYSYSKWTDAPIEAARTLGSAYLGASWLNGGLLGAGTAGTAGTAAGAAATGAGEFGLGGAFTAGEAGAGGLSGTLGGLSGGYGTTAAGTAAGAAGAGLSGAGGEGFSLAGSMDGLSAPGISTGGGLSGMSASAPASFEQMVASSGLTAATTPPGFLDKLKGAWDGMSPLQKLQIGNALGGLAATALTGGGGGVNTAGQKAAGGLQLDLAKQLQGLGTTELGTARTRQAQFDPQFQQIIDAALASQTTSNQRSGDVWNTYKALEPAQRRLADMAADYGSTGKSDAMAAEARAGVDANLARARDAMGRDIRRTGGSLSAGRGQTLDAAQRFASAKLSAGADRAARQNVENTSIGLNSAVANMANPTASLAGNFTQQGLSAGQAAAGTTGLQQQTYNASLQPTFNAFQGANSAAGGAGNTFNGVASTQLQQNAQDNQGYAGLGSLIGTLGAGYFLSDRKTKKVGKEVSGKRALRDVEDAKVYDYKYKPGLGDGKRHIGRMAGKGDIDTPQGKAIDVRSELGRHGAAIKELAKEVRGLASAKRRGA
jgi:hypothetical protein